MEIAREIEGLKQLVKAAKSGGKTVAFVPTMGALHAGHLSLIDIAHKHAEFVVVSIYVNPKQFGPDEDFDTYPRVPEKDIELCKKQNVDIVFLPDNETMYGNGPQFITLKVNELSMHLDGKSRLGFFDGIVTVVNKLFNIVEPDVAVFGQKDFQQFRILSAMAEEFNHPVKMIMAPIARAGDGLALSSRNAYLTKDERILAPSLYRSLCYLKDCIENGILQPKTLLGHQKKELQEKGLKIDYLGIYDISSMAPVEKLTKNTDYLLAGAVYAGKTRLIDNLLVHIKS